MKTEDGRLAVPQLADTVSLFYQSGIKISPFSSALADAKKREAPHDVSLAGWIIPQKASP